MNSVVLVKDLAYLLFDHNSVVGGLAAVAWFLAMKLLSHLVWRPLSHAVISTSL